MNTYSDYVDYLQKIADYNGAIALLSWDNEVNAPHKGAAFRGKQIATLASEAHKLFISPEFGELLAKLSASNLSETEAHNVRLSLQDYQRATKLPVSFVKNFAEARTNAYQAWVKAREANDYNLYIPALSKIVELCREKANLMGYKGHIYNALLDEYEEGATVEMLDPLFAKIKSELVTFVQKLQQQGKTTDNSFIFKHYPKSQQWENSLELLKTIGYDMEAGRQDYAHHPFCTTFSPADVRVTTRVNENDLMGMVGNCIHEGGHALYEQGLPETQYGLPLGAAVSLGIHESQSRLWENHVGLSRNFWASQLDRVKNLFPSQLEGVSLEHFYKSINQVAPNLIRTEADELHYHLHVLIRYELEKGLIDGSISVANLGKEWNNKYKTILGVDVPNDKQGVLQDIHWAEGLLGYFPTYSLGSFYAAQFFAKAVAQYPEIPAQIAAGNTTTLLKWLRENVHQHGRTFLPNELCRQATGEPLNVDYFLNYIKHKYAEIYQIEA